jgi:precorrin-3B synthase
MAGVKPADRCPGVLRTHRAEDGVMIRLRLPGGQIEAGTLRGLSDLAGAYGSPDLQLTSRAGVQLRALPESLPADLVAGIGALGLLPSRSHERVRNIVASPLSGVFGGRADVRNLVHDVDRAVMSEPLLAELSGRFLFVIDDGRGDVATGSFDLGYRALDQRHGLVLVGNAESSLPVSATRAADVLIGLAREFVQARRGSGAWHVRELPEWVAALPGVGPTPPLPVGGAAPLGAVGEAASVVVPLAMLTPSQVVAVQDAGTGPLVITPWRGLVLPGGAGGLGRLTAAGLLADPASPWAWVTACVGAPSCARAVGNTRAFATRLVISGEVDGPVHVSGCERRCGAPVRAHRNVLVPAPRGAVK